MSKHTCEHKEHMYAYTERGREGGEREKRREEERGRERTLSGCVRTRVYFPALVYV